MSKSADAFRTISEVADWLGVQPHVLRFWESKFTQVKPVKRAGGRRYYRPADMLLLGGIRKLLHEDGLTIKGAQKVLREEGVPHVAAMSHSLDDDGLADAALQAASAVTPKAPPPEDDAQISMFDDLPRKAPEPAPAETSADAAGLPSFITSIHDGGMAATAPEQPAADLDPEPASVEDVAEAPMAEDVPTEEAPLPSFLHRSDENDAPVADQSDDEASNLPSFLSAPPADEAPDTGNDEDPNASPRARVVDAPDPDETQFAVAPSALSIALRKRRFSAAERTAITPLVARLAAHRDQLASGGAQTGIL